MKRIAVMQPYFFPYLGYFQLVHAVDHFVFYDDVNFIKGGWIHRNRILSNSKPTYFGLKLSGASPNKLIKDVEYNHDRRLLEKLLKTIRQCYSKSKSFDQIFPILEEVLKLDYPDVSSAASASVIEISSYLDCAATFHKASDLSFGHRNIGAQQRLIDICSGFGADTYINASGGKALYDKTSFKEAGIELLFIECSLPTYSQGMEHFIPGLSMVDVLMHNTKEEVQGMIEQYILV